MMNFSRKIKSEKELAEWKSTRSFLQADLESARSKGRPEGFHIELWEIHKKQLETAIERCDILINEYEEDRASTTT